MLLDSGSGTMKRLAEAGVTLDTLDRVFYTHYHIDHVLDLPGICLVSGVTPNAELLKAAAKHDVVLLVSPDDLFETCGRLYAYLKEQTAETA